jgi:hypothetical protein
MRSIAIAAAALAAAAMSSGAACGGGGEPTQLFPANYAASFVQVRPCRPSPDHDLDNVTVLADPTGADAYRLRDRPFPVGSIVLKAEHGFSDMDCTKPPVSWTVMVKLTAGSSPTTLDWHWQKVDVDRTVETDNEPRCYGCHTTCGVPPDGYEHTCSVP